jgi:hypothetical protein
MCEREVGVFRDGSLCGFCPMLHLDVYPLKYDKSICIDDDFPRPREMGPA